MKFSALALAPVVALAVAADSSSIPYTSGETFTTTVTVQENGNVFLKTRVEVYTGQALTDPTSGTATTVLTISNSLATYTKTVVETFHATTPSVVTEASNSTSDDVTTTVTFSQAYDTYTKTITGDSSIIDDLVDDASSAESSSSSGAGVQLAAGLGSIAAVAALFL